ncbi:MAG: hypothetical protein EZS28_046743, partial [Streblomastix strix]
MQNQFGKQEEVLIPGSKMKKKERSLPHGNIFLRVVTAKKGSSYSKSYQKLKDQVRKGLIFSQTTGMVSGKNIFKVQMGQQTTQNIQRDSQDTQQTQNKRIPVHTSPIRTRSIQLKIVEQVKRSRSPKIELEQLDQ